jgi:hypothetical protein
MKGMQVTTFRKYQYLSKLQESRAEVKGNAMKESKGKDISIPEPTSRARAPG